MNTQTGRAKEIFLDALEIAPADQRGAFLDRACAGDPAVRAEVENLLAHHQRVGSFMATVARDPQATAGLGVAPEGPGATVGQYRLLEQVGEGGMGLVFVAEQFDPVRRRVALKVIKPGMDTREVVARFEAERQALALMDHPNIARVLDGGSTPSGRPYFVMELVRGAPVTEYCDRNRLRVRERLELFVQVCHALQHAHQKGVIHRDLKPSNVLVTEHDGRPVAKVIDFGVAKAVGAHLTDKTVYTRFMQMLGTPLYMSPEQAGMSGLDVDTRSDIYSLGVLLYELLTGTTPFDRERFRTAGFDELRRIIREEEPAKPSARLSTLNAAATTVSAKRGTDPRRLSRLVRGELDWVVMKALEKDRNRRYESAAAFAADIERYLADEPVQACPPSRRYRLRKFVRRNAVAVGAACAVVVVLLFAVAGLAATNYKVSHANQQKDIAFQQAREEGERAKKEAEEKEKQRATAVVSSKLAGERLVKGGAVVNAFFISPATDPKWQGDTNPQREKLLVSAVAFLEDFVKQQSGPPEFEVQRGKAYGNLGFARVEMGDLKQGLVNFDQEAAVFRALVAAHPNEPEFRAELGGALNSRAKVLADLRLFTEAEQAQREALDLANKLVADYPEHRKAAEYRELQGTATSNLGVLLKDIGRVNEAVPVLHAAIAIRQKLVEGLPTPGLHPLVTRLQLAHSWVSLGTAYHRREEPGPAEGAFREALKVFEHESLKRPADRAGELAKSVEIRAMAVNNLGAVQHMTGRHADAEKSFREAMDLKRWLAEQFESMPKYRYDLAGSLNNLANVLSEVDRLDEAQTTYEKSVAIYERLTKDYPRSPVFAVGLAGTYGNLAKLIGDRGGLEKSLPMLDKAVAMLEPFHRADERDAKVCESLYAAHHVRAVTLCGLNRHRDAVPDFDRAVELAPRDRMSGDRMKRASCLLNLNQIDRALADARAVAESQWSSGEDLVNAAAAHASVARRAGEKAGGDKATGEALAARAVVILRESTRRGGFTSAHPANGFREIAALRGRPDFQALLADEEALCREALAAAPNNPARQYALAQVISHKRPSLEALSCLWAVIDLRPDSADAHDLLGYVLSQLGDLAAAEAAYRTAAKLYADKDRAYRAYLNLGNMLGRQQRQPEAMPLFCRAIALHPRRPEAYFGLGLALGEQGRIAESIGAFRAAVECNEKASDAHGNLGFALMQVGEYREAKAAVERSCDLSPPDHPARPAMKQLIADCDRLAALADRLPAVLDGTDEPADAAERAGFAEVCLARGLHRASAQLYAASFRERPQLAAGRRFDAARAAVLAARGSRVPFDLFDRQRTAWREQARGWLAEDLKSFDALLGTPDGRTRVLKQLLKWQRHPDFAGVRDKDALAELPEGERARWREFWSEADAVLARVKPKAKGGAPDPD